MEDKEELNSFVASPTVKVYYYHPVVRGTSGSFSTCFSQLEEVKRQVCMVLCFQVAMSLILGNWILIFTTSVGESSAYQHSAGKKMIIKSFRAPKECSTECMKIS